MTTLRELFIDAMVEAQEFVTELHVVNEYNGYDDIKQHPFTQAEETKLNNLFEGTVAEHTDITEDMIVIVLSGYAKGINRRLQSALEFGHKYGTDAEGVRNAIRHKP